MSGIAGIIHFDGAPVAPGLVESMTRAMSCRGPDGIDHWVKVSVALGQCMLRTTPESLEETQPLTNEDETLVLVMDGRVDNWEELRRELLLHGAVLRTRADAELVLRAYQHWGTECLSHIDGDFALVIWDAVRREAFCARDRMGSKPFNYRWDGRTLAFASELHAIVTLPFVTRQVNEGVLAEYLAAEWYSRDETLWKGILRLEPAHRMSVTMAGPQTARYWEPDLTVALPCRTDDEFAECYRALLFDSVGRLSRSCAPLAIEVSGGLDSSAICCVAENLRVAARLRAPSTIGFTLPFAEDARANEVAYAREVGDFLGVKIREVLPSFVPLAWFEDRARAHNDFPGFPSATMAQALLFAAASAGSRAIVNGVGGDEWLAGSRCYYAEEISGRNWRALGDCFRADAMAFGNVQAARWLARHGIFAMLPPGFQDILRRMLRRRRAGGSRDTYWLAPEIGKILESRRARSRRSRDHAVCSAGQRQLIEFRQDAYLGIAREEAERLYAGSGLEPRRPLHTSAFVQFAFSTPSRLRLRGDRDKYIHTLAMKGLMPESLLKRKDKAEFSVMFRAHLDRAEGFLLDGLPQRRPQWVTRDGVGKLLDAYRSRRSTGWPHWVLWSLLGCDIFQSLAVEASAGQIVRRRDAASTRSVGVA